MNYSIDAREFKPKEIYDLGSDFAGTSKSGETISFTNYYMKKNGKPFFGVSGEVHFSRMEEFRWEDEIIKMKMCGINVIATYVFWNHHEEEEGVFDFSGRRNVKKFIELCKKHGIYVILRVGPFDHGEVRNGGLPDWLYGKPFEVRKLSEGFLFYTRRLYTKVAKQVEGLFFQDDGPIIATQIDNEYMHSSAPWEMTTGISDEWVFGGDEGDTYMLTLKKLAADCGLNPVFYTCTGWGGAVTPDSMMPLWGGYAYRPWLFYSYKGEHPSTEEYRYQDFHNNDVECTNDFKPRYKPEERPYACCEMGGGMGCSYYYRFKLPYKSVDAMANIKMASGCNFLGYYMFQGGNNPVGKHGAFLNESQVPKISYDYQAAIGEFGQIRESYQRLKSLHYFVNTFGEELCGLKTILPEGASEIDPKDLNTLRFAVRTDGEHGFLFLNNFQDHEKMPEKKDETVIIKLPDETITFENLGIAADENAILPFHMDLDGIDLVMATAQPVTVLNLNGERTYVFLKPEGMNTHFVFEEDAVVDAAQNTADKEAESFLVRKGEKQIKVLCISRKLADQMYIFGEKGLVFTTGAFLEDDGEIRIESTECETVVCTYPGNLLDSRLKTAAGGLKFRWTITKEPEDVSRPDLGVYKICNTPVEVNIEVQQTGVGRYTIAFPDNFLQNCKDARLEINYKGDIGHAFIDGELVHDNFCNGDTWVIGLKGLEEKLRGKQLTIYITPLKEGANVNVQSAMAARIEEVSSCVAEMESARVVPVYEIEL